MVEDRECWYVSELLVSLLVVFPLVVFPLVRWWQLGCWLESALSPPGQVL